MYEVGLLWLRATDEHVARFTAATHAAASQPADINSAATLASLPLACPTVRRRGIWIIRRKVLERPMPEFRETLRVFGVPDTHY